MHYRWLAGLVCLSASLVGNAPASPDWRLINRDEEREATVFADAKSIALQSGQHARGWALVVMGKDMNGMAAIKAFWEFDCTNHKRRMIEGVGYDAKAKIISSSGEEAVWKDIPADSFYATTEEYICSGGKADIGRPVAGDLPIEAGRAYLTEDSPPNGK